MLLLKNNFISLATGALIIFSGCADKIHDSSAEKWIVGELEVQVQELSEQNSELTRILRKMNSSHLPLRLFVDRKVSEIEFVKKRIEELASVRYNKVDSKLYERTSIKNIPYPPTITFKDKKIPKRLSQLVLHLLVEFDNHPLTDGSLEEHIDAMVSNKEESKLQASTLFDDLSFGEAIEVLEMIQIRMLISENKYLQKEFDPAINSMYLRICN